MYQYNVSYLNDQKKLYSPRIFFSKNTIPNTKENLDHNLKQQKYLLQWKQFLKNNVYM